MYTFSYAEIMIIIIGGETEAVDRKHSPEYGV